MDKMRLKCKRIINRIKMTPGQLNCRKRPWTIYPDFQVYQWSERSRLKKVYSRSCLQALQNTAPTPLQMTVIQRWTQGHFQFALIPNVTIKTILNWLAFNERPLTRCWWRLFFRQTWLLNVGETKLDISQWLVWRTMSLWGKYFKSLIGMIMQLIKIFRTAHYTRRLVNPLACTSYRSKKAYSQ